MPNYDIFDHCEKRHCRYALGKSAEKMIICIGLNPSIATDENTDRTFSKIIKITKKNNYDGFVLLNLYPEINSKPEEINIKADLIDKNLAKIQYYINKYPGAKIWCAWGDKSIKLKKFHPCLNKVLDLIKPKEANTIQCVVISINKSGQPRHPLFAKQNSKLTDIKVSELQNAGR